MAWNGAFPSSPLSRSALRGDTGVPTASSSRLAGDVSDEDANERRSGFLAGSSSTASQSLTPVRPRPAPAGLSRALDQHGRDTSDEGLPPSSSGTGSISLSNNEVGAGPSSSGLYDARRAPSALSRHAVSPARPVTGPSSKWVSSPGSARPPSSPMARTSAYESRMAASPPSPRYFTSPVGAGSRRRSSGLYGGAASPAPLFGSLIGSFEESLLSGRMSTFPSKPLQFDAELGVLGMGKCKPSLKCPPHLSVKFPAYFYNLDAMAQLEGKASPGSPYVGTIDLEGHYLDELLAQDMQGLGLQAPSEEEEVEQGSPSSHAVGAPSSKPKSVPLLPAATMRKGAQASTATSSESLPNFPGYRIPPKGQIQVVIKNPNLTAVKLFLVPYDLSDMPPGTKTFIRQKSLAMPVRNAASNLGSSPTLASDANITAASAPSSPHLATPSPPASLPTRAASGSQPQAAPRDKLRYVIHLQFCSVPAAPPRAKSSVAGAGFSGRRDLPTHDNADVAGDGEEQEPFEIDLPSDQAPPRRSSRPSTSTRQAPRIYLHKTIRVVFAPRVPDRSEKLTIVTDTPGGAPGNANRELMYAPYTGPCAEWKEARQRIRERQRRERFDEAKGRGRSTAPATGPIGFASPTSGNATPQLEASSLNSDPNGERWRPPAGTPESNAQGDDDDERVFANLAPASSGSSWGASSPSFARDPATQLPRWGTGDASSAPLTIAVPAGMQMAPTVPSSLPTSSSTLAMARTGSSSSSTGSTVVSPSSSSIVEDDGKALLDAWHQTLRRGSAFASLGRPMSPAGRNARPTSPHDAIHRPTSAASNTPCSGTPTQMTTARGGLAKSPTSPTSQHPYHHHHHPSHRLRGSSVSSHHSSGPNALSKLSKATLTTEAVNDLMASASLEDLLASRGASDGGGGGSSASSSASSAGGRPGSSAGSTGSSAVAPALIRQLSSQRQAAIDPAAITCGDGGGGGSGGWDSKRSSGGSSDGRSKNEEQPKIPSAET